MKQSKRYQLAKTILKSEIGLLTYQFMGLMNNDTYAESDWGGFRSRNFTFNDNSFQLQLKHQEGEGEVVLKLLKFGAGKKIVKCESVYFPINGYLDRYLISRELANLADISEYIYLPDEHDKSGRHTFLEKFARIVNVDKYIPFTEEGITPYLPGLIQDVMKDGLWRNELPTFQLAFYKGNKFYYYDILTGMGIGQLMRKEKIAQFSTLEDFSKWLGVKLVEAKVNSPQRDVMEHKGEMELRVRFYDMIEVLYVKTV